MHKVIILACCCCTLSLSFSLTSVTNTSRKLNISLNKNRTLLKTLVENFSHNNLNEINEFKQNETDKRNMHIKVNKTDKAIKLQNNHYSTNEGQNTSSMLYRIHARITRSKDAVWAAITLTFMCILLVLAVAQSRMWKDRYHSEAQGVPFPNFNERVLFKDVMEHKIATLKKFFKKKSKEKNVTELESLLPPSEWDD